MKFLRVASYQGMIFGNLDKNAMSLEDYLGDMKWYMDMMLGRSDGGMEVRGFRNAGSQKQIGKVQQRTLLPIRTMSKRPIALRLKWELAPRIHYMLGMDIRLYMENGHGINVITSKTGKARVPFQSTPESMWPMFEKNLTPEQLDIQSRVTVFVGGMYPNLSFVSPIHGTEGQLHNYLNFRLWRPIGPDKVEVWCWFMIDKAAPEEYKEAAYRGYLGSFGPTGTLEVDDTENWARIVEVSSGLMARDKELNYNNINNYLMGLDRVEPDPNFPGPGKAYPTTYLDAIARSMHEQWFKYISEGIFEKEEELI